MFSLPTLTTATLASINTRAELHGDEKVPAADLNFSVTQANSVLSEFGPRLLDSIYWNNGDAAQAGDMVEQLATDKPNLKSAMLAMPLKLTTEIVGGELTISHGIGKHSNVVLGGVHVKRFSADCKEGGSVVVGFQVQAKPSEKDIGKIYSMIGQEVEIMLLPPGENAQSELEAA